MKKSTFLFNFLPIAVLALSCAKEPETTVHETPVAKQELVSQEDKQLIPGIVVVQVSETLAEELDVATQGVPTKSAGFNQLAKSMNICSVEHVFPDGGRFEKRHREAGLHRWFRIRYDETLPATKTSVCLESLEDLEGVLIVERPRKKTRMSFDYFNDPYSYYQWYLYNDASWGNGFKNGADIHVVPVWESYTTGSPNVIVAVLDGGVDLSHEDLSPIVLPVGPEGSRNFAITQQYGEYDINPDNHGTHVAGIIAAVNNNKTGISSIAGGKDGTGGVRIMSCSLSSGQSEHLDGNDAEAFVWAADHGAVIANNSWGFSYDTEADAKRGQEYFEQRSSSLKTAIDYFIDYAGLDENGNQEGPMKGGVVLFSAGNEAYQYGAPASYSRVIAVGATQPDNAISSYSQYGTWIDLWAPGGGASGKSEQMILSSITNNHYGWMSGTSQACPNATGVAALLVSYFGGPGFTNEDLKERLVWGAKFGDINLKGKTSRGGKLDALGSFTYGGRTPVSFTTGYSGSLTFHSHEKAQISYAVSGNEDEALAMETYTSTPIIEVNASSTEVVFTIDAMKGNAGKYYAGIIVGKGTQFQNQLQLEITILPNSAPEAVSCLKDQVMDAEHNETATFSLSDFFRDADGEDLTYKTEVGTGSIASATVSAGVLSIKALTYGQTGITVTATDAWGESAKMSFLLLARDLSRDVDLYPNPVSDYLTVRPSSDGTVSLTFYNQIGTKTLETEVSSKLFTPEKLDVSALPAGVYTVILLFEGRESRSTIVKL